MSGSTNPATPAEAPAPSVFAPLAYRDFRWLFFGFVASHVGDSVQLHAQAWLVTDLTRSGLWVGLVALAQAVPRLLLGLLAGVVIDRLDRRRVLFVTQTLALLQSLGFLSLLLAGRVTYGRVVLLAGLLGVFDTLNLNARVALMPTLVPRPLIGKAVALQALGVNVVQLGGPSLAALLIHRFGVPGCMAFNAGTFLCALGALVAVRPPRVDHGPPRTLREELGEGLRFVRSRPLLLAAIALAYLHGFFGVSVVRLVALFARAVLGTTGRGYGFLAAASGLGAVAASVLVTARARPAELPRNITVAAALFSLALGSLALVGSYGAAFASFAALGFGQMAFRSAVNTTIQLETPDRLRGRVVSLLTLDFSLWSLGAVSTGLLIDALARLRAPRPDALAFAMHASFGALGVVCLLCVLVLGRTVLRARLQGADEAPAGAGR